MRYRTGRRLTRLAWFDRQDAAKRAIRGAVTGGVVAIVGVVAGTGLSAAAAGVTGVSAAPRLTPPGTHLRFGQTATLPYEPLPGMPRAGHVNTVAITVLSVTREPASVVSPMHIGVPYFIRYKLTNVAGGPLGPELPAPFLRSTAPGSFFGTVRTRQSCRGAPVPATLAPGKSLSACEAVATRGVVSGADYLGSSQRYIKAPVTWSPGRTVHGRRARR